MYQLRPYQQQIKTEVYAAWDAGAKNVLLVMPTGMGKTVTFCSITYDLAVLALNKLPTAIVVHRKELVQQISLTLCDAGITHNIISPKSVILGIIAAQRRLYNKQFYDYLSTVSVISVDTLNARIDQHDKWAKTIRLWITDEAAHLLKSNKWGKAIQYFPDAIGLGVTATPQRLDKRGLGGHADGVFDTMVEGPNVKWGINNGYLSKYKIAVPKSDYERYLKKSSNNSDFSHDAMVNAAKKSRIIGDVVENYLKFAKDKQAILFASDIETAAKMEDNFLKAGVTAKLLTGFSTDKERLEGILNFKNKNTKVLLNVDLFDEGLDVPGIEVVIHARPTMSLSKYMQMNGRGLRPAKNKEFTLIIDHVGNVNRHGLPCDNRYWTLDRIINKRQKVNLHRVCSNIQCNAPYDRALTECPWCGTEAVSSSRSSEGGRTPPELVDGDLYLIDPETIKEMEAATNLEDPAKMAERIGRVIGVPAGMKAMKNQMARIQTQKELSEAIAVWAGKQKRKGYTDRQIHKVFYLHFDKTITQALGEPKAEMLETMEKINGI